MSVAKHFLQYCLYAVTFMLTHQVAHAQEPSASADLSMRGMIRIVQNTPDEFSKQWDARKQAALAKLTQPAEPTEPTPQQVIEWQWASGLINYPFFHQRETGQAVDKSWAPRLLAIKNIDFQQTSALQSRDYIGLIEAWLHDRGLELLQKKPYTSGDNRWLRAKFSLIEQNISNAEVKRFFLHKLLAEHIDENGAKNTDKEVLALAKAGASAEQLKPLQDALTQENTPPKDHQVFTYKQIDGVDLQTHVFSNATQKPLAPVFIWFHGGSWSTGHWSYCPVICRALQAQGFVVVQVEYRTSQRFDGSPLDALSDAYSAVDWVIQHAKELQVDPQKIMTGGFSSGASLASQMAVLNHAKVRAGAYMSGCYDPAADNWYNMVIGDQRDTTKLSPLRMLDINSPPQLFFHAKDDEMCAYQTALTMQEKLQSFASANRTKSELISFDDGGHFFVFQSPPAREKIKAGLASFVRSLAWVQP